MAALGIMSATILPAMRFNGYINIGVFVGVFLGGASATGCTLVGVRRAPDNLWVSGGIEESALCCG